MPTSTLTPARFVALYELAVKPGPIGHLDKRTSRALMNADLIGWCDTTDFAHLYRATPAGITAARKHLAYLADREQRGLVYRSDAEQAYQDRAAYRLAELEKALAQPRPETPADRADALNARTAEDGAEVPGFELFNGSEGVPQAAAAAAWVEQLPPLVVACPACGAPAGDFCRSHGGSRPRRTSVHQRRTAAYAGALEGGLTVPAPEFTVEVTTGRTLHGQHGIHDVIAIRATGVTEAVVWNTARHTPKWDPRKAMAKLGWKVLGELSHDEEHGVRTGQAVPVTREERVKAMAAVVMNGEMALPVINLDDDQDEEAPTEGRVITHAGDTLGTVRAAVTVPEVSYSAGEGWTIGEDGPVGDYREARDLLTENGHNFKDACAMLDRAQLEVLNTELPAELYVREDSRYGGFEYLCLSGHCKRSGAHDSPGGAAMYATIHRQGEECVYPSNSEPQRDHSTAQDIVNRVEAAESETVNALARRYEFPTDDVTRAALLRLVRSGDLHG